MVFFGGWCFFRGGMLTSQKYSFQVEIREETLIFSIFWIFGDVNKHFRFLKWRNPHLNNLYGCKAYVMENPPPK